jgi:hypothetical protein
VRCPEFQTPFRSWDLWCCGWWGRHTLECRSQSAAASSRRADSAGSLWALFLASEKMTSQAGQPRGIRAPRAEERRQRGKRQAVFCTARGPDGWSRTRETGRLFTARLSLLLPKSHVGPDQTCRLCKFGAGDRDSKVHFRIDARAGGRGCLSFLTPAVTQAFWLAHTQKAAAATVSRRRVLSLRR